MRACHAEPRSTALRWIIETVPFGETVARSPSDYRKSLRRLSVVRRARNADRAETPLQHMRRIFVDRAAAAPTARDFIPEDRRTSAHVRDAPLRYFLGWRFWLCRKLEHRCLLILE
jgi:hypothetical protein